MRKTTLIALTVLLLMAILWPICTNGHRRCDPDPSLTTDTVDYCQGGDWTVLSVCPNDSSCSDGTCVQGLQAPSCSEGAKRCDPLPDLAGSIDICQNGQWTLDSACGEGMICNGGACAPDLSCTNGDRRCSATPGMVDVCQSSAWTSTTCPDLEGCVNGECSPDVKLCKDGTARCLDEGTYQTCLQGGWGTPSSCPDGQVCSGGSCASPGSGSTVATGAGGNASASGSGGNATSANSSNNVGVSQRPQPPCVAWTAPTMLRNANVTEEKDGQTRDCVTVMYASNCRLSSGQADATRAQTSTNVTCTPWMGTPGSGSTDLGPGGATGAGSPTDAFHAGAPPGSHQDWMDQPVWLASVAGITVMAVLFFFFRPKNED